MLPPFPVELARWIVHLIVVRVQGKSTNREEFYFKSRSRAASNRKGIQHLVRQMLNARWQMADTTLR
jgi:hypothetical protein